MSYVAGELWPFPFVWLCSVVPQCSAVLCYLMLHLLLHFTYNVFWQGCTYTGLHGASWAAVEAHKSYEKCRFGWQSSIMFKSSNSPLYGIQHQLTNVLQQSYWKYTYNSGKTICLLQIWILIRQHLRLSQLLHCNMFFVHKNSWRAEKSCNLYVTVVYLRKHHFSFSTWYQMFFTKSLDNRLI